MSRDIDEEDERARKRLEEENRQMKSSMDASNAQQKHYEEIMNRAPNLQGKPNKEELEKQIALIKRKKEISRRKEAIRAEENGLNRELKELDTQCIHYEPDGSSALYHATYSFCKYCSNYW